MIDADAVGGDFPVVQTDLTDQRLLPFVFAPRTDDFHKVPVRAKLMPNEVKRNTQNAWYAGQPAHGLTNAVVIFNQSFWIDRKKVDKSKFIQWDVIAQNNAERTCPAKFFNRRLRRVIN